MNCPKCGYANDSDAEFCENCGCPLKLVCPHCNSPIKPGSSFCKICGAPVRTSIEAERQSQSSLAGNLPQNIEAPAISSAQVEGERKPVTILFTDVVDSTSLAAMVDPEEWKEVISGAHQRVIQVVHRYEGTVAQLLGDGVLVFFGAPLTHEDDPVRAVRAALDIQREIGGYAYELKGYIDNFQMRIGVNTGTVVAGNIGSEVHMEYLAIGDAVNLAARLQSAAEPGRVLISENTARLVKPVFVLSPLKKISVKGIAKQIGVYEVVEVKALPERSRGFEELASPLVGRETELAELKRALDELCRGHGQIVTVLGEAGIGKSRLVEEARCSAHDLDYRGKTDGSSQLNWIEGRALSYGASLSFWTISQLIKNDLGLSDADPEPRIRVALWRQISKLFGEQAGQVLPYLARLLGVRLESTLADQLNILDGETLKRQTLLSIMQYFEKLASLQPTVAVFEDLHWADPSSLEALEMLLSVTDRAPLMLLLLSRLEREQPAWRIKLKAETDFAHRYTEIQLKPLSPSQQSQLVDNMLRIADLPETLRKLILERAEGNPFYLEEIVRNLIEQGAIRREGEQWIATKEILTVTIPDTLQGVLLARLDRLQEDVRRTLQLASVIGRSFLYSILEMISQAEHQLDTHLAQLQRLDLVREKARLPELEYMFKHSLTQEAAYSSLLIARRSEFHRKIGEALEKLFPDRLEDFYGMLAYHYETAGENLKAIDYLTRAGDKARLMAELTEAIGYYQRSIPLLTDIGDSERLAQAWLKLGLAYYTDFQFEEAHQANEKAFALQKQAAPSPRLAKKVPPGLLRICSTGAHVTLDPGISDWESDVKTIYNLFAGLVQIDAEQNVVPDVARSWQVLDGGRKYLLSLRDDVRWSDGSAVTAHDFEYAWKRNLHPALDANCGQYLFDVVGAQDYHEGRITDPDSIGIHALDDLTLEVRLKEPVAFFPFILSMPISFPLPRRVVERYGKDWWHAETIISNGPYRLVELDVKRGSVWEPNPYYYGEFPGNCERIEFSFASDTAQVITKFRENSIDMGFPGPLEILGDIPEDEKHLVTSPRTDYIIFGTSLTPVNDVRVRKALGLAIDRDKLFHHFAIKKQAGGFIPPGIPGHSPDLGLPFDPKLAQLLLADAGYPDGQGFPAVTAICRSNMAKIASEISSQWHENLGIDIIVEPKDVFELIQLKAEGVIFHLFFYGWMMDYPDPDNILCQEDAFLFVAIPWGWHDETYLRLVREAGKIANQKKRMEMYRQADRMLVQDQVVIIPIGLGSQTFVLAKPWVKNLKITPNGRILSKDIVINAH